MCLLQNCEYRLEVDAAEPVLIKVGVLLGMLAQADKFPQCETFAAMNLAASCVAQACLHAYALSTLPYATPACPYQWHHAMRVTYTPRSSLQDVPMQSMSHHLQPHACSILCMCASYRVPHLLLHMYFSYVLQLLEGTAEVFGAELQLMTEVSVRGDKFAVSA